MFLGVLSFSLSTRHSSRLRYQHIRITCNTKPHKGNFYFANSPSGARGTREEGWQSRRIKRQLGPGQRIFQSPPPFFMLSFFFFLFHTFGFYFSFFTTFVAHSCHFFLYSWSVGLVELCLCLCLNAWAAAIAVVIVLFKVYGIRLLCSVLEVLYPLVWSIHMLFLAEPMVIQ